MSEHPVDGGKTARIILRDVPEGCLISWHYAEYVITSLCRAIGMTQVSRPVIYGVPPGLSVGLIIAESHIFIHTWPETRSARVIVDSCKDFDARVLEGWLRENYHTESLEAFYV